MLLQRPSQPRRRWNKKTVLLLLVAVSLLLIPAVQSSRDHATSTPETAGNGVAEQLAQTNHYLIAADNAKKPFVFAKSILLMDAETGDLLWSQNPDEPVPVASTTKMTTALVARKLYDLDEVVTISRSAANINGSTIGLLPNEKITVGSLLKGMLIQSGNDAATALAEHLAAKNGGEGEEAFIAEMNRFVVEHHLPNVEYKDPAGLDDQGHATARSLAHTARLLLNDPVLAAIVSTGNATITSTDGSLSHDLKNSNRLVLPDSPYYLADALGVKTGFTPDAGHCLVAAYNSPAGRLIGVVLNTADYTITASSAEMKKLFTWAQANIEQRTY